MAVTLNDTIRAIVDGTNFATVATVNPDGSPQSSVVWISRDGDDLLFSTTRGRQKERNLARDPRVSITLFDREDPYKYAEIRGRVTMTEEGGRGLIDALARKYRGQDYPQEPAGTVRVVVRLTPQKVTGFSA